MQVVALLLVGMACPPCAAHLALLCRRRTWVQPAAVSAAVVVVAHPLLPDGVGHHGAVRAPGAVAGAGMLVVPVSGLVLALSGPGLGARRHARATAG